MPPKKYHHGDLKRALIQAGVKILAKEGLGGLSLRKVARKAGVSHSAPYAHFPNKQSLIAAISTEGFKQLYSELDAAAAPFASDPRRQLVEAAHAYTAFALNNPDTFKIMFSGILEKEKDYPAFVQASRQAFAWVVDIVRACQSAGVLPSTDAELAAVALWGQMHGVISLALEGQISHTVLDHNTVQDIVAFAVEHAIVDGARA